MAKTNEIRLRENLDAPECRAWMWLDRDGAVWFWNAAEQEWYTLEGFTDGFWMDESNDNDDDDWRDAPFVPLLPNLKYTGEEYDA